MKAVDVMWGRVRSLLGLGQITVVNDGGPVQTAQVKVGALETRDKTPVLNAYGFTSNPPAGADAVLLFVAGDRSNGVVIATGHQTYRLKGLASGEVAIYDEHGQSVWLKASGIVVNGGGNPITVTDTPRVRFETQLLECTGDILDNCDTQTETMAGQRSIYNEHTHKVPNVEGGDITVETLVPDQQET